jgi:hypothetical protein
MRSYTSNEVSPQRRNKAIKVFFPIAEISCTKPKEVKVVHNFCYAYSRPLSSHDFFFILGLFLNIIKSFESENEFCSVELYGITFIRY